MDNELYFNVKDIVLKICAYLRLFYRISSSRERSGLPTPLVAGRVANKCECLS